MKAQRRIARLALACLIAFGVVRPALAGLQIELVYIENPPQPAKLVQGGGELRDIMTGAGAKEAVSDVKTTQENARTQARLSASRSRTVQNGSTQYPHVKERSAKAMIAP